jgi:hypothetical protein
MSTRVRKGAFAALVCALALIVAFGLDQRASAQTLLGGRAASDDMTLEINVDRPGADMFARSLPGGDVADCQQLCRETSGCTAFTFDRVDGLQAPVCRIKDAAPPPLSARCCVSGIVGAAARAPAPVAIAPPAPALLATTPAPPPRTVEIAPPLPVLALDGGIVSSWPVPVEVRDGYGRCLALGEAAHRLRVQLIAREGVFVILLAVITLEVVRRRGHRDRHLRHARGCVRPDTKHRSRRASA